MFSKVRISLLLIFILCFSLLIGSTAAFAEEKQTDGTKKSFDASPEQLEIIKGLWGKNISKGEFLEKVFPDALKGMKPETVKMQYKTPMVWPEKNTEQKSDKVETSSQEVTPLSWAFLVHQTSSISHNLNQIFFSSSTSTLPATICPFMDVTTYLWRNEDGDLLLGTKYDYDYDCASFTAKGAYIAGTPGYFVTTGVHYTEAPYGYSPPSVLNTSESSTVYIDW